MLRRVLQQCTRTAVAVAVPRASTLLLPVLRHDLALLSTRPPLAGWFTHNFASATSLALAAQFVLATRGTATSPGASESAPAPAVAPKPKRRRKKPELPEFTKQELAEMQYNAVVFKNPKARKRLWDIIRRVRQRELDRLLTRKAAAAAAAARKAEAAAAAAKKVEAAAAETTSAAEAPRPLPQKSKKPKPKPGLQISDLEQNVQHFAKFRWMWADPTKNDKRTIPDE